MKMTSLRQAILMAAVFAGTAALVATPVLAQTPPGPPVCGGVASLMNHQIFLEAPGAVGDNIVSIPAVSPINNNPTNPTANGFFDLCKRFANPSGGSLIGTTTQILQFNAQAGTIATFACDSAAAPGFTPGQAVLIRPSFTGGTSTTGRIPGVECSRPYTAYIEGPGVLGDNLWPTPITLAGGGAPLTATSGGAQDVCTQLGLNNTSAVIRFHANSGILDSHICGTVPQFTLGLGEGVLIRPGATATGTPVIF